MEDIPGRPARARGLRITAAVLLLLSALGGYGLVRGVLRSFGNTCTVCVRHGGRTVCREAVAPTGEEARAIALRRACAFLTAEGAEREACVHAPPESVDCRENDASRTGR